MAGSQLGDFVRTRAQPGLDGADAESASRPLVTGIRRRGRRRTGQEARRRPPPLEHSAGSHAARLPPGERPWHLLPAAGRPEGMGGVRGQCGVGGPAAERTDQQCRSVPRFIRRRAWRAKDRTRGSSCARYPVVLACGKANGQFRSPCSRRRVGCSKGRVGLSPRGMRGQSDGVDQGGYLCVVSSRTAACPPW